MKYKNATSKGISDISELQQRYRVSTIREEDRYEYTYQP